MNLSGNIEDASTLVSASDEPIEDWVEKRCAIVLLYVSSPSMGKYLLGSIGNSNIT